MWFKIQNQQVTLRVFAKANAKRTAFLKVDAEMLYVALHAKPHEGEANKELVSYLAKLFRLPKSNVILQRGDNSRHKIIQIPLVPKVQEFLNDPDLFLNQ
jgi:hypothetical protein